MLREDLSKAKANAQKFIKLQEEVQSVNESTIESVVNSILLYDFWEDESQNEELLHLLIESIDVRPRNTELYVEISKRIASHKPEFIKVISDFLLSTKQRKTSRMFYLYSLVKIGLIPINDVISFIHTIFKDKAFTYMKQHRRFSVTMLCWFLPEIEQDDLDLFSKYKNLLEESHKSPYFKDLANVNIPFIQQFDKLKENNWKLYREYRDIGMNPDPIAMAISDDAVIDYGDVNSTIEPSMFECCGFINHYPTLIQYAAFCGSVNAFFYLQRKNADFSKLDRKNRRLEEYAIAGGNSEIITSVFQSETHISSTPLQENQTRHAPISARRRKIMDIAAERTFSGCRGRVMQPSNFRVQDSPVFATIGTKSDSNSGYSNLTVAKFNRYGVIPPQVDESVFLKACSSDCIKLVIYGIENGIDPNCVDKNNQSGVTLAAINGNVDILRFLSTLEGVNLSVMDNNGGTPLIRASEYGNLSCVKVLANSKYVDVNACDERNTTALIFASMKGYLSIVKFLCDVKGIDCNAMDEYFGPAFLHASMHGYLDIVKYLHSKERTGVNFKGGYVAYSMIYAAHNGFIDVIKYLMNCDDDIDYNTKNMYGESLLTSAVVGHQLETLKFLVSLPKVDLNQTGQNDNTALATAAVVGDLDIVKFLVSLKGVDKNHKNAYGATPLSLAIANKNFEVAEFLKGIGCE